MRDLPMENIKHKLRCPNCDFENKIVSSEFGGKLEIEKLSSSYLDKKELIDHYKLVKKYTGAAGSAWDIKHRDRAFLHAKNILRAIPTLDTAKRAIGWTADEYRRRGLGTNGWSIATVEKWVAEFLVDEARRAANAGGPKCCNCSKPAVIGAKVCTECSWCWKCDEAERPIQKEPKDMVPQKNTPPICRECAKTATN